MFFLNRKTNADRNTTQEAKTNGTNTQGQTTYRTPGGKYSLLYYGMAEQPHLLIAGATGSGKSVVVNGLIHSLLVQHSPAKVQLVLIDPKRVELVGWKNTPHCIMYASEPGQAAQTLQRTLDIIDRRYTGMANQGLKMYEGADIYVVIDELADLILQDKRRIGYLLQRICQIGRAARVHVIACTQCPIAEVIPTQIKVNFDARLGLRTRSAQDSRNILGQNGCETLPRYGKGYYMTPEGLTLTNLPMIDETELRKVQSYWDSKSNYTI